MLDMAPVILFQGKDNNRRTTEFTDIDADWGTGFIRSSSHFVDAVLSGGEAKAEMSAADAIKVLQLCFAVYLASEERRPVDPRTITGSVKGPGWAEW
jgi:predicted dehydrogenase